VTVVAWGTEGSEGHNVDDVTPCRLPATDDYSLTHFKYAIPSSSSPAFQGTVGTLPVNNRIFHFIFQIVTKSDVCNINTSIPLTLFDVEGMTW